MSTAPVIVEGEPTQDNSPGVRTLSEVVGVPQEGREAGRWVRTFTKEGVHPFDEVEWKTCDARIAKPDGRIVFEQLGVEVPAWWDQTAINIVADKYFRVINGVKERSVKQIFTRVVKTIRRWAEEQNYFASPQDAQIYEDELCYALVHQLGAFNSPVWFNLGIPGRRQAASACFISGVDDTLESINAFGMSEKTIFAGGSGSGANLSSIRSSYEKLSSGAYVCGPLGWMEEHDKGAKAMKSGGSTRNAAKMVVLDMDHPDILQTKDGRPGFIRCKSTEEKRAHDLIKIGYSASYDDPNSAYKWVAFQNANHSVSIPDAFMKAVVDDGDWNVRARTTGEVVGTYRARELWTEIAKAAWTCGDPGVQFSDTINRWHTTPAAGKIRASNPCFHPDTRIATEFGLVRIEDLCAEFESSAASASYFGTLVQTQDGPCLKPAIVFPTGVKPVVEIHTRRGRVLKVTRDHRLMTTDGWTCAEDLSEDSVLCIQGGQGAFASSDPAMPSTASQAAIASTDYDPMWYKMAGWVVGDGWILKGSPSRNHHEVGFVFGKDDKDVMEVITSFLSRNDIPFSSKTQDGSVGESPDYVRIRRKAVWEVFSHLACEPGSKASTKRVMDSVFRSTRNSQLAFLSGLFSADGTFNIQPKKSIDARFSSTSLGLLRDVQALLLNLGVNSTIYKDRRPNDKPTFSYTTKDGEVRTYFSKEKTNDLVITGESLKSFKRLMLEVGLLSARKQVRFDDVPSDVNNYGRDRWTDEVVRVVDNGETVPVFDVTEGETHSLIADGVVAHNCSEFLHVDNTACNLCAVNLTRFFVGRQFQADKFEHAIRVFVTAQNAIIAKADYPTPAITRNSHALRPIGLNYGDLGALLMKLGLPYDSDGGRAVAGRLASLMTGYAYLTSARLAARTSPFPEFRKNKEPMLNVMRMHQAANASLLERWSMESDPLGQEAVSRSFKVWDDVLKLGERFGYTISQATLQAPLGTISFLMGMDTTGIEPGFSLVSYKSLVGGGYEVLANKSVRESLFNLGYGLEYVDKICNYMSENGHIEGAPGLADEDLPVFDCAMPSPGGRCISPIAHLKMMAAIQPLITCAMSKTVNLVNSTTPEEIAYIYLRSWELGLKCVALYRDGCKMSQPLATKEGSNDQVAKEVVREVVREVAVTKRTLLPEDASATSHRFTIGGFKGYLIVSEYKDGRPGEVFIRFGKNGSTMNGLIDGFTKLLSIAIQHGVPVEKIIRSFVHTKFEPSGITSNKRIRFADSLYDYLFKFLDVRYFRGVNSGLDVQAYDSDHEPEPEGKGVFSASSSPPPAEPAKLSMDGPPCGNCGTITQRNGACYLCKSCGQTTGCS